MTMQEYVDTLAEMDELRCLPKNKFMEFVKETYDKNAMLIKPSLYFRLFRRPWNFICTPYNKLLKWVGRKLPLRDAEGNPMSDRYIHFTAMLQMAGFIPLQDYGWHVVDAIPISKITPKKFKRYFKSQCKATERMPKDKAVKFLEPLYAEYKKKHQD